MSSQSNSSIPLSQLQRRTRGERVAQRSSSRSPFSHFLSEFRHEYQGAVFIFSILIVLAMGAIMQCWDPPFRFRVGQIPLRAIVCITVFSVESPEEKQKKVAQVQTTTPHIYINDPAPLVQLRDSLWNTVTGLVKEKDYHKLDAKEQQVLRDFFISTSDAPSWDNAMPDIDYPSEYATFLSYFADDPGLDHFKKRLEVAFRPIEEHGTLMALDFGYNEGNQEVIRVYRRGQPPQITTEYKVSDVLLRDGATLRGSLRTAIGNEHITEILLNWTRPKLPETLKKDSAATKIFMQNAIDGIATPYMDYAPDQLLIDAGTQLLPKDIRLLRAEHHAAMKQRDWGERSFRYCFVCFIFSALLVISWGFVRIWERRRPRTLVGQFAVVSGMFLTILFSTLMQYIPHELANLELLPLLLFVQIIAITYSWEISIVLGFILVFIMSIGLGIDGGIVLTLLGTVVTMALQLRRLQSRKRLVAVSFVAGVLTFVLTFSVGYIDENHAIFPLIVNATLNFLWTFSVGFITTGLLPFIEEPFGILTDMSLLEIGHVSHPLLQSLNQHAPATYGHSLQVGIIAETAANAIGARALMTRVGAYFHDVGKIMKPEFFFENQGNRANIHDHLEPQVSMIVLVAHVKDGVDLARQHHLPTPLIDLIEQHHGNSLANYFYMRAVAKNKEEGNGLHQHVVDESSYRYPGPKPQSKEAAILMIADASESACRSLGSDATPGKIENRVRAIVKERLDDGQFDDSGLTLHELKVVENSVIKSIIAAMHGRIKYPGQTDDVLKSSVVERSPVDSAVMLSDRRG